MPSTPASCRKCSYGEITVALQYEFQAWNTRIPGKYRDLQHAIVAGAGARPVDSNGNLLADFTANANAQMQGRLAVARLYRMTDDHGVRDLLSCQYLNSSDGKAASDVPMPQPDRVDARCYGTTDLPNIVEKTAGAVQDKLKKE